ncbi:uncharacterized protein LOC142696304 [Rhinoderma darwinii]|uniref:uncharacterized protein LOC142696304 n=1 Tax=Rhinoderma darwinii TaxID=43563 RepID=UPI003F67FA8F
MDISGEPLACDHPLCARTISVRAAMSSAGPLYALAFLISAGEALRCIDCKDFSGKLCSGASVTCPAATDICLSTLVQYEINSTNPQIQNVLQSIRAVSPLTLVRGCGYLEECTEVIVLRTSYSRTVTSNRCCKSDLCTPETPTALSEAPKNTLTCPGCFQLTPDSCQDYKPVQCRGDEVQCFSYTKLHLYDNASTDPLYTKAAASTDPLYTKAAASTDPLYTKAAASTDPLYTKAAASTDSLYTKAAASTDSLYTKAAASTDPLHANAAAFIISHH